MLNVIHAFQPLSIIYHYTTLKRFCQVRNENFERSRKINDKYAQSVELFQIGCRDIEDLDIALSGIFHRSERAAAFVLDAADDKIGTVYYRSAAQPIRF